MTRYEWLWMLALAIDPFVRLWEWIRTQYHKARKNKPIRDIIKSSKE